MTAEQLIVPALRGSAVPWPVGAAAALETAVLDAAADHGVAALLAAAPGVSAWPGRVRSALADVLRMEAAAEAIRRQDLQRLLAHLGAAGIRSLLLKGAQIAHTHYPRPWLRPRLDTDLLVAPGDRLRVGDVLRELGYRPGTDFGGELVSQQFQYEWQNRYGLRDYVDLHWKIANPHVFAETLTFEELERHAVPIPVLGPNARGLSDAHALVLACIHRVAHHYNSNRLIWLYDIHLLAGPMTPQARDRTADLVLAKRLGSVCVRGIVQAQARLGTAVPREWLDRLQAGSSEREPTAAFLQTGQTKLHILRSDLQVLRGWRPKVKMIREHLFPPLIYIRRTYGFSNPVLVPFAYAYRIAMGVGKWSRRRD